MQGNCHGPRNYYVNNLQRVNSFEQRHFYANKAKTEMRHFCLKHYKTRYTPAKRDRIKTPMHGQHPERDQNEIGTRCEFA